MKNVCPGCGAVLPANATRCDLCGTSVTAAADERGAETAAGLAATPLEVSLPVTPADLPTAMPSGSPAAPGVFCPACGHRNLPAARYCNQCGTELPVLAGRRIAPVPGGGVPPTPVAAAPASVVAAPTAAAAGIVADWAPASEVASAAPAVPASEQELDDGPKEGANDPGKRALQLAGLAVAAVVIIFIVRAMTADPVPEVAPIVPNGPAAILGGAQAGPAPTATGQLPAADVEEIAVDPASISELPLPDTLRAAAATAATVATGAQSANTAAAWADAGTLYFRLAEAAPEDQRAPIARQAIAMYQRSLAIEDNPDVRAHMAGAYKYDTVNPMQAIVLLRSVLATNPDHPEANLRMGMMRLQIGRTEEAEEAFRTVIAATSPTDPLHIEAAAQLQALGRLPITN